MVSLTGLILFTLIFILFQITIYLYVHFKYVNFIISGVLLNQTLKLIQQEFCLH